MKKVFLTLMPAFIFYTVCFGANQGETIFQSNRCGACHKADVSTSNPSLKDIAQAYKGKGDQLQKYLKGEAEPLVNPARSGVMKKYLEKTKSFSESERKALLDFIMAH